MCSLHVVVFTTTLALLAPSWSVAQEVERQGSGSGSGASSGGSSTSTKTVTTERGDTYSLTTTQQEKPGAKPRAEVAVEPTGGRWVRALTNVQVELTITDQTGTDKPEKKTVTMIVSSGSWGRIRTSAAARPAEMANVLPVGINVDARPFVSVDGPIQLELTIVYNPSGPTNPVRPTELNQSLTVILQSGKPLVVSQAADPMNDRKVIAEVKATVLK